MPQLVLDSTFEIQICKSYFRLKTWREELKVHDIQSLRIPSQLYHRERIRVCIDTWQLLRYFCLAPTTAPHCTAPLSIEDSNFLWIPPVEIHRGFSENHRFLNMTDRGFLWSLNTHTCHYKKPHQVQPSLWSQRQQLAPVDKGPGILFGSRSVLVERRENSSDKDCWCRSWCPKWPVHLYTGLSYTVDNKGHPASTHSRPCTCTKPVDCRHRPQTHSRDSHKVPTFQSRSIDLFHYGNEVIWSHNHRSATVRRVFHSGNCLLWNDDGTFWFRDERISRAHLNRNTKKERNFMNGFHF